eukprot:7098164-Ditylum_brightwellii.AAC.2
MVDNILEDAHVPPREKEEGYDFYKSKGDFVKNHCLMVTMGSNAALFISVKTMAGIEMYSKFRGVFQGKDHEEDVAINASTL